MSTKTLRKRIALVAVSALGFGLVSAAPSNAVDVGIGDITAMALAATTTGSTSAAVNGTANVTATISTNTDPASGETITLRATLTSRPTASAAGVTAVVVANKPATGSAATATGANATTASLIATAASGTALDSLAAETFGRFTVSPDVAGSYVLTVWHDQDEDSFLDTGETFRTIAITGVAGSTGLYDSSIQVPISTNTTANAGVSGLRVNAVAMNTKHVSGRVGVPVVLWPSWQATANATAVTTNLNAVQATTRYTATNPAGTAQAFVLAGTTTASTVQHITGTTAAGLAISTRSVRQPGGAIQFTPATAGVYTITTWHDNDNNEVINIGEASSTLTITIAADAAPSITMTTYGVAIPVTIANGVKTHGALVKLSLKMGTNPASLSSNEVVTVTSSAGATTAFDEESAWTSDGLSFALEDNPDTETSSITLSRVNFNGAGEAYFYVSESTNTGITVSLTAVITGGTAAGGSGSGSVTVVKTSDRALVAPNTAITNRKGLAYVLANPATATPGVSGANIAAKANLDGNETYDWTTATGVATSLTLGIVPGVASGATVRARVADSAGLITGLRGATYTLASQSSTSATTASASTFTGPSVAVPVATADLLGSALSTAAPAWTSGTGAYSIEVFTSEVDASTETELIAVGNATPQADTIYVGNTAEGLSSDSFTVRAGVGATTTIFAQVYDQHGRPAANIGITPTIAAGQRNPTAAAPIVLVTDASGLTSYKWTDASTSTTVLSDVLTLSTAAGQSTGGTAKTGTATLNYAAFLPVAKITMTTPDSASATATGIAGQVKTDISSLDGAEAGAIDVKVVLTDANGATLPSGVAVTFSVAGTGAAILSTHVTRYTDASGAATTKVYGWTNGDRVVTATSGTVTATGTIYFRQDAAVSGVQAEARTIAAKATGNVVTATVTDRFGNPISGISVIATRVGTGTFNGTSSITGVTDAAGTVDFVLTNGTADVTVSFTSPTFGASAATKGFADAGITALTASVAGTAGKAEVGVGASFDAAGVNSVKVAGVTDTANLDAATAATDAAAEATDAANAATDAANAAAEAADAATAAAQDAADAVAALSTQVTELVSALRKQITSLTNLVIKIQRKVRA